MQSTTKLTIKLFLQHLKPYKWLVFVLLTTIIGANIAQLISPLFYKKLFDLLGSPETLSRTTTVVKLLQILFTILLINGVSWIFYRTFDFTFSLLQPKVIRDLSRSSFQHILHHSYQFFINSFAGSLVRRINRLTRSFEEISDDVLYSIIPLIVTITGILLVLFKRNFIVAICLIIWIIIFLSINYFVARWKAKFDERAAEKDSETTGVLSDALTNSINIKLFNGYKFEENLYKKVTEELRKLLRISWGANQLIDAIQTILMIAIEFTLMYFAIKFWVRGQITIGDFALIQSYLIALFERLWNFARVVRHMYRGFADAKEMVEILNTPYEVSDTKSAKALKVSEGKIEFKNVIFSYQKTRKILDKFNLVINPGEKVALVGSSGAGKSTIIKLLFRFFDIDEGKILIDDQNIGKVFQESLRDQISLVPQEPVLFHRTLMDNIRYGRRDAKDNDVYRAAKKARCHEFINELQDKYNTFVGERGIKLSGGERQRVAIARAILKNAPILLLDEATSSLDSESESLIQDALRELMKNKTTIVIAHRLSTIMMMDRIVVIEKGQVVDSGTHEELLKKEGTYKKLWEIQAGGFLP